ncbi:hypothetical protein LZ198_10035 [Myxococcus sp. K15C18031901]|uniref:hypothetical protein n=1 Tax=Myxococcus dinghuensis TaxID=2906761 RepID=UPI0020A73863|nr:hypothetical protein [Myxococcus dinghuensis]MCP3099208.1 hypothetical protein [Myxococcus dinghuensis]
MKWPLLPLLLLGPALGFLAGRSTAPEPASPVGVLRAELERQRDVLEAFVARHDAPPPAPILPTPAPAVDLGWLRAELARVVREELAAAQRAQAPDPRGLPPAPEPQPYNIAAHQEGQRILDDATSQRRWTDADAQAMRRALVNMTDAQREDVLRRLATAINTRAVELQTSGAPL